MSDELQEPPKPPQERVRWGEVMFGIFLASFVGLFALPLSFVLALALGGGAAAILAFLLPIGAMWLLWRVMSPQNRSLGRGVLIGSAVVLLVAGMCGVMAIGR